MASVKPLVSVIMIFFNAEKFIQEAIESVFSQTYENWELLLIDDGSTDSSTPIALQYIERYFPQVRYLQHEGHQNRGMSASRNLGIRHANGRYVAFLDADDVWFPPKLKEQVAILDAQPEAAMLYGRTQFWFSWTGNPRDVQRDSLTKAATQLDRLIQPPALLTLHLQDEEVYPCMCSILVRREVFDDIGGFEEEFHSTNEDMVFHSKVFVKAPVYLSSKCWDRYRIHPDSCWEVAKKGRPDAVAVAQLKYRTWLEKYLAAQGVQDAEVWKTLRKTTWHYRYPRAYRLLASFGHLPERLQRLAGRVGHQIVPAPVRSWPWLQPGSKETRRE